jgi:hypothetical protein
VRGGSSSSSNSSSSGSVSTPAVAAAVAAVATEWQLQLQRLQLPKVRGSDLIYRYAIYNDLGGDITKTPANIREPLGGSSEFPYPR